MKKSLDSSSVSRSRSKGRRERGYKTSLGGNEDNSFINNTRGSVTRNPEINSSFSVNLKKILNRSTYVKKTYSNLRMI